ncbi:cytochrome ubiquinol oxidase subunit I [Corynebacterium sanguinis]|uniref:cytochrome ubiquinol oxidase subunit I n=1 Tax=Corynebacterium sanguinis TaxID=2594913 RepID=UPI00223C1DCC|nr:cytochrome ubiquinol oxidase subunit I [Corynebacterium sanguinis]MCT1585420.1 cytochrome ubiquinol oxidase subunit I [Corynebacterium sanguinis]MCT2023968.1 cytochrome ubiquinol oxidase subunit I [Corynebacterium sanguinis]MCT2047009.1 cytochrome ubiquinol oxidase subunit I [Corynebacterium sanguinis]MDN8577139.1 cytochrome ubiquinol oxidase subunit I [Corynebacterium sanguinis]
MELDLVDLSRWQFGITTVYHYIFVPLTIGLAPVVAIMQTLWQVTGKEPWYRATRFFGNLFLINFAMGVVTGLVQEFQFGMNWSEYASFVGDVFGAPLAFEGLAAFFFESVFLGVWIFGWGRVPRWAHLVSIWIVAVAVNVSAYFIIVANSFMQHPVGARYNPETDRAELIDFAALLTNPTAVQAVPHAIFAAWMLAGTFVCGIAGWWMVREARQGDPDNTAATIWRTCTRFGAWIILVSSIGVALTGDALAKLMFVQQPMKMASAEALCHTETDPYFSILSVSTMNNCETAIHLIGVPFVLPFLAEGRFSGVTLQGAMDLNTQYQELYGPGNYIPNLFVTYWSFRLMIGFMAVPAIMAVVALWKTRKKRVPSENWIQIACLAALPAPWISNFSGWIFTEMGRQPWVVHPNPSFQGVDGPNGEQNLHMIVDFGVSDHQPWQVLLSLGVFTALYGILAVIWFALMRRYTLYGLDQPGMSAGDAANPAAASYGPADDAELEPLSFGVTTSPGRGDGASTSIRGDKGE